LTVTQVGNSAAWSGNLNETTYIVFVAHSRNEGVKSVVVMVGPCDSSAVAQALESRWNVVYGGATRPAGASWVRFDGQVDRMEFYDLPFSAPEEVGADYATVHDSLRVKRENH
jgi:hypothetical protein